MSKMNKKSINLSFRILAILAFGLLIAPVSASAAYGRNTSYGDNSYEYAFIPEMPQDDEIEVNPKPSIYSLSPKSADRAVNGNSITLIGRGFIPSSVARINGVNRPTTFIDSTHLLLQVNGADMYRTDGGFYVTVWNSEPGGGFSNAEFFTVKNIALVNPNPGNPNSVNNPYYPANTEPAPETFSDLTSNALFGGNTFLPSGIIQWILLAIIILLLVILARKFFGGEEHYQAAPLKHD